MRLASMFGIAVVGSMLVSTLQGCSSDTGGAAANDEQDILSGSVSCSADSDCGGGESCLRPACQPGGPCPAGRCGYEAGRCGSDVDCNGGRCITPACDPRGPCPAGTCTAPAADAGGDAGGCEGDADCTDGYQCMAPFCLPGGPCPAGTCRPKAGRCLTDAECGGDRCVSPACDPRGPCPLGSCTAR